MCRGAHRSYLCTNGYTPILCAIQWCVFAPSMPSPRHSRAALSRIMARVGDSMVTNHRRPILTLVEDTSPGIHDTLIAACDRYRYELLGCTTYHDNCTDNSAASNQALPYT